ncbi:MAG TPA: iron-sulfur cluster biosynthesis family protein [Nitrospiraceae bacterium]|nr:iron-sulfur cluster biosynthesis family protein [Nitrospiraceae bacterium]
MLNITIAAIEKLKSLIEEHPEDPIVRVTLRDLDDTKLSFSIVLDSSAQPEDDVQELDGVTIAVEGKSAARIDGITLDYREPGGFKFLHPGDPGLINLTLPQLN